MGYQTVPTTRDHRTTITEIQSMAKSAMGLTNLKPIVVFAFIVALRLTLNTFNVMIVGKNINNLDEVYFSRITLPFKPCFVPENSKTQLPFFPNPRAVLRALPRLSLASHFDV